MRSRLLILLGLVLFVTSCRKGLDDNDQVTDMKLSVSPTIYGQKSPSSMSERSMSDVVAEPSRIVANAMARVSTRALEPSFTKSKWDSGDKFSMFLTLENDGKATPISFVDNVYNDMRYDNLIYTYDGTKFGTSGVLYYPYRRGAVDLYGIYPYDAELGRDAAANAGGSKRDKSNPSGYLWEVFNRQDVQGSVTGSGNKTVSPKFNVEQADLLYASNKGVLPNNEGLAQSLVFKHVMSKVFVKLLVPKEFNGQILDPDAPIVVTKLLNTYLEGSVDFRADSVYVKSAESTTPIWMRPSGSVVPEPSEGLEGTYYYYECVVIPQSVEGGKNFLQLQVKYTDGGGASFIMRLGDKGISLYSGREHTLDVVFDSKVGLRLNGSYIKDWVEGDGGGGLIGQNDASPAANSYMVSPGDELLLNSYLAGSDVAGISTYSQKLRSGVKSVRLLWQTRAGHTTNGALMVSSIDDSKLDLVRIKTNPAATAGGNAVVAAYSGIDGTGDILWSWHIWVSGQKISLQTYGDKFVLANGVGNGIMDRNLGALSGNLADGSVKTGGLLYQWGRKDPFTGTSTGSGTSASAIAVYDLAGGVKASSMGSAIGGDNSFKYLANDGDNLAGSILNPMTFYYANSSTGDWTNPSVGGLWSNYGTTKSVFDPCPSGYRVASNTATFATGGSWADLGDNGGSYGILNGEGLTLARTYNELGGAPTYSYVGWRGVGGALASVAAGASVHGAGESLDNSKRAALYSGLAKTDPFSVDGKSTGIPVRCVQDGSKEEHLTILAPKSVSASGGRATVKVYMQNGGSWIANVSGGSGFSLSSSTGSGSGRFDLIATSSGTVGRTATVTVTSATGAIVRTVKIIQVPATVVVASIEWCSFNLTGDDGQGAVVKLATEPQDYGKYFKWGDTWVYQRASSSIDGDWTTYTSGAATVPTVSYNGGLGNDYIFGLSGGRASGDPCQKLGAEYFTPSRAQWQALYGTGSKWATYQGVNGIFMGPKAQTCDDETIQDGCIFIPAAGYRYWADGVQSFHNSKGFYWSSSVSHPKNAYNYVFDTGQAGADDPTYCRSYGLSVRCVRSTAPQLALLATAPGENVPAAGKTYTIAVGASGAWSTSELTNVTVEPSSGTGTNSAVKITVAASALSTTRAVSVKFNTTSGAPAATAIWSGTQFGTPQTVVIGGTQWTTSNLTGTASSDTGHAVEVSPQDYGMFFKWGTSYVYQRASSSSDGGGWGAYTTGAATSPSTTNTSGLGYDYAQGLSDGTNPGDPCVKLNSGSLKYRTPTRAQWQALVAAGKSDWTTYNGVYGYFFGAKASTCNSTTIQDGCIFLPTSGFRQYNDGTQFYQGSEGRYWSSSVYNSNYGWYCGFDSGSVYPGSGYGRGNGLSVRCVQE